MGHGDEPLRPLPCAAAHQIHAAVLGDDVVSQTPGIGNDVAGIQQRCDAGDHLPLLIGEGGCQTDEGLAAGGHRRPLQKVQLTAGAADLAGTGALGADLAVQVHGDAVVDGDKVLDVPDGTGSVAVGDGVGHHAGILPHPVVQILGADGKAEHALIAVDVLALVGDLSGPVHIQIAVAQHLRVDAKIPQIGLGQHLAHGVGQRADAQLQGGAVVHVLHHELGNAGLRLRGRRGLYTGQRVMGALHDHIHVVDVDALVQAAVDPRQILVDLQDHDIRLIQHRTGGGVGQGEVEVAVLVHGGHAHHGHVDRQEVLIVGPQIPEHHRVEAAHPPVAELALIA